MFKRSILKRIGPDPASFGDQRKVTKRGLPKRQETDSRRRGPLRGARFRQWFGQCSRSPWRSILGEDMTTVGSAQKGSLDGQREAVANT